MTDLQISFPKIAPDIVFVASVLAWVVLFPSLYKDLADTPVTSMSFAVTFCIMLYMTILTWSLIVAALVLDYTIILVWSVAWPLGYLLLYILNRTTDYDILEFPDVVKTGIATFPFSVTLRWIRVHRRHRLTFPPANAE